MGRRIGRTSCAWTSTARRKCRRAPVTQSSSSRHTEGPEKETEATGMIDLPYSLVSEATKDPEFFGFFSPELEGFSGVGHSVEDCIYRARWGMKEHVEVLKDQNMPVPERNKNPTVTIVNEQKRS